MLKLHKAPSLFSMMTTQCQVKKHPKVAIRYWSPVHNEVWIRYYTSEIFGHSEGATVASAIMSAFKNDNVPIPQLLAIRPFFKAVGSFLQSRLPFQNNLLRFHSGASLRAIEYVAGKLRLPTENIADVSDEWRLYLHDEDVKKHEKGTRVDHYWRDIFQLQTANANPRYPLLTKVVKSALILPHGNSDVERGSQ